jgi:hypothetical protein
MMFRATVSRARNGDATLEFIGLGERPSDELITRALMHAHLLLPAIAKVFQKHRVTRKWSDETEGRLLSFLVNHHCEWYLGEQHVSQREVDLVFSLMTEVIDEFSRSQQGRQ